MKRMWNQYITPVGINTYNGNQYEELNLMKESTRGAIVKNKTIYLRINGDKNTKYLTFADFGFAIFEKLWNFPGGSRIEIAMRKVEE
ncbi:hypothetical protein PMN51_15930 [Blautia wexlerae]|jgi:hypothetical protein|nr:hypothetical protein [Blautia wexlerae]DAT50662.1 MAG TPA: hypothetical protein [Bacteriophage sp.]